MSVVHLDTNLEIYAQSISVYFQDALHVINLRFRVRRLIFDVPGTYLFALMVDDQEIAARRVRVYKVEGPL